MRKQNPDDSWDLSQLDARDLSAPAREIFYKTKPQTYGELKNNGAISDDIKRAVLLALIKADLRALQPDTSAFIPLRLFELMRDVKTQGVDQVAQNLFKEDDIQKIPGIDLVSLKTALYVLNNRDADKNTRVLAQTYLRATLWKFTPHNVEPAQKAFNAALDTLSPRSRANSAPTQWRKIGKSAGEEGTQSLIEEGSRRNARVFGKSPVTTALLADHKKKKTDSEVADESPKSEPPKPEPE